MSTLNWHIVTKNQDKPEKARKLADIIAEHLFVKTFVVEVEKYEKFPNSYSIVLSSHIERPKENKDALYIMTQLANEIVDNWQLLFRDNGDDIELMFNKGRNNYYQVLDFNVINWARLYWVN